MNTETPAIGAVIPAAGFGTRMRADRPKQFLALAGEPILVRTVRIFLRHRAISHVAVAVPAEHRDDAACLLSTSFPDAGERLILTIGGAVRQDSVFNGLSALPDGLDGILVHDGARPMLTPEVIDRCIDGMIRHGAVIAALPVKDTLKQVRDTTIVRTVDRDALWQAQTPQAVRRELLKQAYAHAAATDFQGTDEASLLEHAGIAVHVVEGSEKNIKITRPEDLAIAAGLLERREQTMRIGHGFDAHRLVEGRKLILGGVTIPYHLGLDGHSDADVLTHALMDALLGALGRGDIGRHFPDSDERYRGADSLNLLAAVVELLEADNMVLTNADITLICQQPRLAPHLEAMQDNLAGTFRTTTDRINIKATTTEKMGFTGRGEGISAHAVILLQGR